MFDNLLLRIAAHPFESLTLHLTSGSQIPVPTVDHISVMRHVRRVIVDQDDNKTYHIIRPEHISQITVLGKPV